MDDFTTPLLASLAHAWANFSQGAASVGKSVSRLAVGGHHG